MPPPTPPQPTPESANLQPFAPDRLLQAVPIGLGSIDPHGRIRWLNQALAAILGESAEALIGRDLAAILLELGPDLSNRLLRAGPEGIVVEATARHEPSSPLTPVRHWQLSLYPSRGADGSLEGADLVTTDVPAALSPAPTSPAAPAGRDREAVPATMIDDERLRSLIESSPNGVVLADEAGVIQFANRTAAEMFGYSQDDLNGRLVEDLVPEGSRRAHPGLRESFTREPSVRPMGHGRYLFGRRRDGSVFPLEIGLASFESGGARFVSAVLADITARRTAEMGLRESEARLAHAMSAARMVAWEWDVDRHSVSWSANAVEVLGQPPSTGDELLAWVGPAASAALRAEAGSASGTAGAISSQFDIQRPAGDPIALELEGRVSVDPQGRRRVAGVLVDVSRRRQAEDELRRTSETLAALVAASPVAIVLYDTDGTVRLWNETAERMFGWSESEVLGHRNPAVPADRAIATEELLARIVSGETAIGYEDRWVNRDGKAMQVAINAGPVRGADGWTVGIVGLIEDVTSRRALEEQLLQGQKMEGIGRLAGGVAHDFNNMLTAIRGFADLLSIDLPPGSEQQASLDGIREASERATALTRQLLAFSRRQHLEPKVLDLNRIVTGFEPMLRRLIGEDIDLVVVTGQEPRRTLADPSQLEQVILNLVVNARDAMPDGGRLTIETGRVTFDDAYALEHYEVPPGDYVMLAVSDTGVGMDRDTRLHVFEPFFTTKDPGKGTGLGLSTIYGIVRQSGGHIWLYSEPGHGTTFKLYFPLSRAVVAAAKPGQPAGAILERGTETILLVEDEAAVRSLMTIVLERNGYRVLGASGGDQALKLARDFDAGIDLLVTDVVLGSMSGPEVARSLRLSRPGIATLLLSGYTEEVFANARVLEAADGFLSKPFTPDALARKVREVLAGRQPAVAPDTGEHGGAPGR